MEVISLEEGRVVLEEKRVIKRTSLSELNNMKFAFEVMNGQCICVGGVNYKLKVPKVYEYKDNKIVMERCFGENLEIMLREKRTHKKGVTYTNQILSELLKRKFYWRDFAPRNILISDDSISIMDFERGFNKEEDILLYFLHSAYEEYSAFLLPEERTYKMDDVLKTNINKTISIQQIKSRRVRTILHKLGYNDIIPLHAYVFAIRMIIVNEEPYIEKDDIIYPLLELEEFIAREGYEKYADRIIGGYNEKIRSL